MADGRTTLPDIFRVLRSPDLSEPEKVLWGLYRSYDSGDGAWPGDESLQAHMSAGGEKPKSIRAIQGYRASLIRKGYLTRKLNGPNPAVYRAVVPCETSAESCTSLPARGADSRTSTDIDPQDSAPLGVKDSAPLGKGVKLGVKLGVQDSAPTPTPPIEEEYGEYGKTAEEEEKPDSSGSVGVIVDGFEEFADLFPEAMAVLRWMKHLGGEAGTAASLRTAFLYVDESMALPDPSVRGLDIEMRQDLVARALIEMRSQGVQRWAPRALAGFVRRVRDRPDPEGDHPGMTAAEEEERERNRREAAGARRASTAAEERLTSEAQRLADELADDLRIGRVWLEQQPQDIQEAVTADHASRLRREGWRGPQDRAPVQISAPAMMAAIRAAQELREERKVASA